MSTSLASRTKSAISADDLGQQIETLRADLVKLAATLSDDVSQGIGQATHKIGQTGRDAQATATKAVIDHPLAAVGIAAGIGLLFGLVARRG